MLIVFDGIDRAGKSTHLRIITQWLKSNCVEYLLAREPGGTIFAEKIRRILLWQKDAKLDPVVQLLLFSAARYDLTKTFKTMLEENPDKLILCDRFIDSTYAYQGQFFTDAEITAIAKMTVNVQPDFVFLFLNSYGKSKNNMDDFANEYRAQIIARFKKRAISAPEKYFIVPNGHLKKQQEIIRHKMLQLLQVEKGLKVTK